MRFNDLLRTVLASRGEGAYAVVTRWRQCIDLLAQYDISGAPAAQALSDEDRDRVLAIIRETGPGLTLDQRVCAIAELGGRLRSACLVRLLAQDHPTLVSAMLARARLADEDWAALIPELGPLARSILRRRETLGPRARQALDRFGPIDLSLPPAAVPAPAAASQDSPAAPAASLATAETERAETERADAGAAEVAETGEPSQIGRIVAQIERFTGAREHQHRTLPERPAALPTAPIPQAEPVIEHFTFEADVSGQLRLIGGASRADGMGLSIGTANVDSRLGADGTALGAFRRRAAFSQARFMIGEGRLKGEWRISGEPRFDPVTGRFQGYLGAARREQPHEGLVRGPSEGGWSGLSAENARQLIHELRTPLNAIQGFAEMIDAELLGPVTSAYREMARNILVDAGTLIATFDDLDLASRLERGDAGLGGEALELGQIVRQSARPFMADDVSRIVLHETGGLPPVVGARAQIERMIGHLLRAACALLEEGEALHMSLAADPGSPFVQLAMRRPRALAGLTGPQLFDHGMTQDQRLGAIPPLGLAFTLRLVRGIAAHGGGRLDILPDLFTIVLPALHRADSGQESRG